MKKSLRFEKVLIFIFIIGIGIMVFMSAQNKVKDIDNIDDISNKTSNKEELIGNFNTMKLYITDYVYTASGYVYNEVPVNDDIIKSIKDDISKININDNSDEMVYGQYKLVLDDKVIFYDINNNSAMYNNKIFKFSKDLKNKINITNNTCSCCDTSNCNINLCRCINNGG